MDACLENKLVVVKLGGSVLADEEAYRQAARFVVRRLHKCSSERFVVVVSAQKGTTDDLEALARAVTNYPDPKTLDLLWSTGELRSVAILTLQLESLGVSVVGLNVHEAGLRCNEEGQASARVELRCSTLQLALENYSVTVVPGFFATRGDGALVSLGRGGSDLTAVLLAAELGAERCELVKDVGGYFSADPNSETSAVHIPSLSYERALEMAANGCKLVQGSALQAARAADIPLVVRGIHDSAPASVVSRN